MMRRVELTAQRQSKLKKAFWGNAKESVSREILLGGAALWEANNGELLIVTRLEPGELVIVAAAGQNLRNYVPFLIDLARDAQAHCLRWHTRAPEHLARATAGLPIMLDSVRKRPFGADEHIFKLGVV